MIFLLGFIPGHARELERIADDQVADDAGLQGRRDFRALDDSWLPSGSTRSSASVRAKQQKTGKSKRYWPVSQ